MDRESLAFFVVPTRTVNKWLVTDFKNWLETPGKGGRPHSPTNKKRHLFYSSNLEPFREKWDILWQ